MKYEQYVFGVEHWETREWNHSDWSPYPRSWICDRWVPLAEHLDVIRNEWGKPITLTPNGGYRSTDHNKAVGGSPRSQHMQGRAADLAMRPGDTQKLWDLIWRLRREGKLPRLSGVGRYSRFVHVDVGGPTRKDGSPRRWVSKK